MTWGGGQGRMHTLSLSHADISLPDTGHNYESFLHPGHFSPLNFIWFNQQTFMEHFLGSKLLGSVLEQKNEDPCPQGFLFSVRGPQGLVLGWLSLALIYFRSLSDLILFHSWL